MFYKFVCTNGALRREMEGVGSQISRNSITKFRMLCQGSAFVDLVDSTPTPTAHQVGNFKPAGVDATIEIMY